ncbi:MAG: hypothetical protein MJ183_09660, partial [Treponemataceae bacterium]|nr:hypothetical protein [Treponemataceae bacterium]
MAKNNCTIAEILTKNCGATSCKRFPVRTPAAFRCFLQMLPVSPQLPVTRGLPFHIFINNISQPQLPKPLASVATRASRQG